MLMRYQSQDKGEAMKAKEYYEAFLKDEKETGEIQAFTNMINGYFAEVKEIAEIRMKGKIPTNLTMISIFKEQALKWNAMIKFDQRFKRNGFIDFAKHKMPFLKDILDKYQLTTIKRSKLIGGKA